MRNKKAVELPISTLIIIIIALIAVVITLVFFRKSIGIIFRKIIEQIKIAFSSFGNATK